MELSFDVMGRYVLRSKEGKRSLRKEKVNFVEKMGSIETCK